VGIMDTLIWLMPTLVYICGYAFCFRRVAGQIAWHCRHTEWTEDKRKYPHTYGNTELGSPDSDQWMGAILGALFLSLAWPLTLPIAHGIHNAPSAKGIFYCPPSVKMVKQQERIAELERQAGIR